ASSILSRLLNALMWGIEDSPTPTMPISSDSTSRMRQIGPSTRAHAAAATLPAVPPPRIRMWRTGGGIMGAFYPRARRSAGAVFPNVCRARDGCVSTTPVSRARQKTGSEPEAHLEAQRARHVQYVPELVHLDLRVQHASRADAENVEAAVVLVIERVQQVHSRGQLVIADVEYLGGLEIHRAVTPDVAADQEAAGAGRIDGDRLGERAVGGTIAVIADLVQRTRRLQHDLRAERHAPRTVDGPRGHEPVLGHVVDLDERVLVDGRLVEREVV